MPSEAVRVLRKEIADLRQILTTHLIESGGIKTQLKINTWLTGAILAAVIGKIIGGWF